MKEKNRTQMVLAIVVLAICLIVAAALVIWKDSSQPPTYPIYPILKLTIENNSNGYILYIENCSDPDEVLELEDIYIYLRNVSWSRTEEHVVADILNNKNSNVAFYDNDYNGMISVGDEFQIDNSIILPGMIFNVIFKPYGWNIGQYQFTT